MSITVTKQEDIVNRLHFYFGLNLRDLPTKERDELEKYASLLKQDKRTILYTEGETPKGVYILIKGKVKYSHLNPDGTEQIYFIYTPGDVFGYRQILGNSHHMDSVTALEDCEFLFIDKNNFLFVAKNSTSLMNLFLKSICREFTALTNMINIFAKKSIRERTAYFLLALNEKYKLPGQIFDEAEIKVSRTDLASYIGASVENLVRTIREFKDKNYIRVDGKSIYINDFTSLHSILRFEFLD